MQMLHNQSIERSFRKQGKQVLKHGVKSARWRLSSEANKRWTQSIKWLSKRTTNLTNRQLLFFQLCSTQTWTLNLTRIRLQSHDRDNGSVLILSASKSTSLSWGISRKKPQAQLQDNRLEKFPQFLAWSTHYATGLQQLSGTRKNTFHKFHQERDSSTSFAKGPAERKLLPIFFCLHTQSANLVCFWNQMWGGKSTSQKSSQRKLHGPWIWARGLFVLGRQNGKHERETQELRNHHYIRTHKCIRVLVSCGTKVPNVQCDQVCAQHTGIFDMTISQDTPNENYYLILKCSF